MGESGRKKLIFDCVRSRVGEYYLWSMQKGFCCFMFACVLVGLSTAQGVWSDVQSQESKPKTWGLGVRVRHFGWDMGVVHEVRKSKYAITDAFWLGTMRDPREMKVINERLPGSSAFAIERVTHNLCFRYQKGKSLVLSERNSRSDIGLRLNASVQLPLNYSWPLHVWLYNPIPLIDGYTAVAYDPSVHDVGLIGGTAGYGLGFSQGKLIPGLGGNILLQAEWGSYRNVSNSLSMGFGVDRFVQKLPMWYRTEMNRNFFPSVFVTFAVGFDYGKLPAAPSQQSNRIVP